MKLSDYIADFIAEQGIQHVFVLSGGAAIHMIDSVSKHLKLTYIVPQHEQGGSAAADAYARITQNLGAMITTSGPGTTNLVTSICNAYFDSIPVLFLSGQVATFRIKKSKNLRQKGFQETDMVSIFTSITKYAMQLKKAADIGYELEKAVYIAKTGRPGPVLIDIPDDLQRAETPKKLRHFKLKKKQPSKISSTTINHFLKLIQTAKRPVLIYGAGVRLAKVIPESIIFARHFKMPVLLSWGALDILPFDDELNMGGIGVCGPRAGNFAAQNADLIIAIGTRLSQMITGGRQDLFAPTAKKIMVDIDLEELNKFGANDFSLNLKIHSDIGNFFRQLKPKLPKKNADTWGDWRKQIKDWQVKYPICPQEYYERKKAVDAHVFIKELSHVLEENDIIVTDAGGNLSWTMQAFEIKKGQRLLSAWNHSPMGYSLPASIGAALASKQPVYCVIGDGGIMMCLEELGTVRRHNLPIKLFIFNNHGHGIQKQTLDTWLNSRYIAVDEPTGLWFPDFKKIAAAFEIPYVTIENHELLKKNLIKAKKHSGPIIINVEITPDQKIRPMLKFGAGLEDLDPKLPAAALKQIMAVSTS